MSPMYPRSTDTCSPFRARPEIVLLPLNPLRRQPKEESVLGPLITASAFVLICTAVAWPAGRAIAFAASLF